MKILMVCLGNICRSPLAEDILTNKTQYLNIKVESTETTGISYWEIAKWTLSRASIFHNIYHMLNDACNKIKSQIE